MIQSCPLDAQRLQLGRFPPGQTFEREQTFEQAAQEDT